MILRRAPLWLGLLTLAACHPTSAPPPANPQTPPPASRVAPPEPTAPVTLKISELSVAPDKPVRIRGTITSIVGMRMVPAKVIFKISDSTETITVVINEQVQLKEGARIELVGRYKQMPAPMHTGPGEPPRQAVFEVERYVDLP